MPAVADAGAKTAGLEALRRLKSTEPPVYLAPSPELSKAARSASEYLFSSLSPYAPKSPFTHLLTEGFDPEQIWQQIDLQAQPLLTSLRRHVRNFEKNPEEIEKQFNLGKAGKVEKVAADGDNKGRGRGVVESESEDLDDDDDDQEEEEEEEEEEEDDDDDEDEDEEEEDGEDDEGEGERKNGVEDQFFKIKELEKLIAEAEEQEYGIKEEKKKRKRDKTADEEEESEDEEGSGDEEHEDDDEEDDELGLMGLEDADDEKWENARYEDFFVRKKTDQKRKPKHFRGSDDMDMDEPEDDDDDSKNKESLSTHEKKLAKLRSQVDEMEKANLGPNMQGERLSTHEKELATLRTQIEEMERANLEPKTWTMQGEVVTAAKRPKNSALEVDLDFEHNVRPAPVITEEVTASLEELIQKRILEGRFDDVHKPPALMAKAPREKIELDENKSKKGLAELYEDEYAQKTGLVSAALSFSDEQKKEVSAKLIFMFCCDYAILPFCICYTVFNASMLFKKLCIKLDALSHFHFSPKPVIEDMSIQANVPALAMEEIAPLAVSDAAMLAPEEVFSGKGDIKEETELTKEERKRRRANKKRKFKAESAKKMTVKAQPTAMATHEDGNEDS
ncbi:U3 small nucleolar ribonucleoprotein protein mpp10 [Striga asiatica]|uniref:U3 small nucleolar ribonucleoprotein protein MPP10 n=1 Tax=Striga asiatica TaxID=4170 RepID=A0A5A7P3G8_STRAF|nr:U3 small nucleolar ribonucleoprotein protein mpp10 [Striga asiatica]